MRWRPQLRPHPVPDRPPGLRFARRPEPRDGSDDPLAAGVDAAIAALATSQGGNVTRAQLRTLELSDSAITRRRRSGLLIPRFRGVYAVGHLATGRNGLLHAALLAVGDGSALSHRTGASVRRYLPALPGPIDVLVSRRGPVSRAGIAVHETRIAFAVTVVDGLRVTDPLRTLQDLAAIVPRAQLEAACSEALVRGHVTQAQLDAARILGPAEVAPSRGRFERELFRLLRTAGLPLPLCNSSVGPYVPDYVWPEQMVILEADGYGTHGGRRAFEADRERDAALAAAGWVVLRVTWRQLNDTPAKVVTRIAQVLAVRGQNSGNLPQPR